MLAGARTHELGRNAKRQTVKGGVDGEWELLISVEIIDLSVVQGRSEKKGGEQLGRVVGT